MLLVLISVLTSCSLLRGAGGSEVSASRSAELGASQAYVRPGDRVALHIWNEEEMTDTFAVAESGLVTLPKLGPVQVGNKTVSQLQDSLLVAYSEYLQNPSVDVVVLRRVGVIGEVKQPGLYLADLTMTLPDLIARAGGITEAGNPNDITLLRGPEEIRFGAGDRSRLGLTEIQSGDQIIVGQRSYIARNPLFAISSGLGILSFIMTQLIPALK